MVSSLSLLLNRNRIFRLKNGSSRQFFLIPQSYILRGNLHLETPVLQSEIRWFILSLNPFVLSLIFFQIYFFFVTHFTFQIIYDINWVAVSFSANLPNNLTLWVFWFYLNNFDIFCIHYHCIYKFLVFYCFKIWYESKRCQFSIQIF